MGGFPWNWIDIYFDSVTLTVKLYAVNMTVLIYFQANFLLYLTK